MTCVSLLEVSLLMTIANGIRLDIILLGLLTLTLEHARVIRRVLRLTLRALLMLLLFLRLGSWLLLMRLLHFGVLFPFRHTCFFHGGLSCLTIGAIRVNISFVRLI